MIKSKKCKGTGRAKGHGCGKMVPTVMYGKANRVYGLGKSCKCYAKWLLNSDEGMKLVKAGTLKATKTRRDLETATKDYKDEKTLPYLLINTRTVVHDLVKERDKGKPCISCDRHWDSSFHAGHCYAAGDYSSIRFNWKLNIHGQCPLCNIGKNGNETEYLLRLPARIGKDCFEELTLLAKMDKQITEKWDREALNLIRTEARKELKKLKL